MGDGFAPRAEDRRRPARLVYDTLTQQLPAGVRAVGQRARRLLFAAEDTELMLQVSADASPNGLRVMGQVLEQGMPLDGAAVRFDGPASPDQRTDRDGEFRLSELPKGDYRIEVDATGRVIETPAVELQ